MFDGGLIGDTSTATMVDYYGDLVLAGVGPTIDAKLDEADSAIAAALAARDQAEGVAQLSQGVIDAATAEADRAEAAANSIDALFVSDYAGLSGARDAWDFKRGVYRRNYAHYQAITDDPRWTFARTGAVTSRNLANAAVQHATGAPRITDRGLFLGPARTNLLLNSASLTGAQSATVTAVAHTLSFRGGGSVAISGVYVGNLAGVGPNDRVSITFTPTAGSLTVTPTGSVTEVQLEAGAYPSEWIPTTGAAASVTQDSATITLTPDTNWSLVVDFESHNAAAYANNGIAYFQGPTSADRVGFYIDALGRLVAQRIVGGVVSEGVVGSVATTGNNTLRSRAALVWDGVAIKAALNGGALFTGAAGAVPTNLATLYLGRLQVALNNPLDGWIRQVLYIPVARDAQVLSHL